MPSEPIPLLYSTWVIPVELPTTPNLAYLKQRTFACEATMTGTAPLKQRILDAVDGLPANATMEDAIERLVFVAKVERGIAQAEAGKLIPHDDIVKRFTP